ncbi:Hypothetical predicted protein [Octopus vulgaris]|uniref:Uncharacterized protein n=1 Tax=Octopus vulgaris TaxID=6645 RepID=A0AA36HH99_OCTVU|nr:Hypothetical predicted protein [Octopus vulgaris]
MATRARSGRHWAQCPRPRDNSERMRPERCCSGRHWAQCPRPRDNSERYGDQSSLWAPLGSMSAATRQQ